MAGFHNPYMQKPDFGQGFSNLKDKALMVLLAMMGIPAPGLGGEKKQQEIQAASQGAGGMGASPTPPMTPPVNTQTQLPAQGGPLPQGVGSPFGTQMPQDPQLMMMLMQMMQGRQ